MNLLSLIPLISLYLALILLVFGLLAVVVIIAWLVAEYRWRARRGPGVWL